MTEGTALAKIAIVATMAGWVVALSAAFDSWRNHKKYAARERERKANGGLD